MKRFAFRLQKVLDVNEIREERAQRHFADAERARGLQNDILIAAESAVANQRTLLKNSLSSGINAGEALINHRFGLRLQRQAGEESRKLKAAAEVASDRRKELTEAARRTKMLEILKDKELEKYGLETARSESGEADELAGRRFVSPIIVKEIDV